MRTTLPQLIVEILSSAKRPLVNSEIRDAILSNRLTTAESIDTTLTAAAKAGLIEKKAVTGLSPSKFLYSVPKKPTVTAVVQSVVKGSKIDSLEVLMAVRSVLPTATKASVDTALYTLAKKNKIVKSKNPMTDSNTISSQSKFLYSAK